MRLAAEYCSLLAITDRYRYVETWTFHDEKFSLNFSSAFEPVGRAVVTGTTENSSFADVAIAAG